MGGQGGMTGSGGGMGSGGSSSGRPSGTGGRTAAGGSPGESEASSSGGTGGPAAGDGATVGSGGAGGDGVDSVRNGSGAIGGTTAAGGMGRADGGAGIPGSCITQSSKISAKIATVGVVTWSTTLSGLSSAHIDFGLDTSYGMTAPVASPSGSNNTTLLLGMKQRKTYHYRIVVSGGGGSCTSDDATLATGSLANRLPTITVATSGDKSKLSGGFLVTGQYLGLRGSSAAPAYILDADGEIVWAYDIGMPQVTGVKMSYDGTHMWINTAGSGSVHRVAMDGSTDEDLSKDFTGLSHQLTVEPDETVAFYSYNDAYGCEDIKEYSPSTGTVKTIVNSSDAEGMTKGSVTCHCNNVQYSKDDDTLVFSDLFNQVIVKIKRSDGSTVWRLNGPKPTITGVSWVGGQHGIDLISLSDLLIFNNNSTVVLRPLGGTGDGSIALKVKIDLSGKTASQVWAYKASPTIQNDVMGDLQRLPNGNTVVAYSTKGVIQEVDSQGNLLSEWEFPSGTEFGYIEKRMSMYGAPLR